MRYKTNDEVKRSILYHIKSNREQLDSLEKTLTDLTRDDISFTEAKKIFDSFMSVRDKDDVELCFLHISSRIMARASKTDKEAEESSTAILNSQDSEDKYFKEKTEKKKNSIQ